MKRFWLLAAFLPLLVIAAAPQAVAQMPVQFAHKLCAASTGTGGVPGVVSTTPGEIIKNGAGNGSSAACDVAGFQTAVFQLSGTAVVYTDFEASIDGATYSGIQCYAPGASSGSSGNPNAGLFRCNIAGLKYMRARLSGWVSGTRSVSAHVTTSAGAIGTLTP